MIRDERGLSSVEYATLGGVMSAATLMIGSAVHEATMVALQRIVDPH